MIIQQKGCSEFLTRLTINSITVKKKKKEVNESIACCNAIFLITGDRAVVLIICLLMIYVPRENLQLVHTTTRTL